MAADLNCVCTRLAPGQGYGAQISAQICFFQRNLSKSRLVPGQKLHYCRLAKKMTLENLKLAGKATILRKCAIWIQFRHICESHLGISRALKHKITPWASSVDGLLTRLGDLFHTGEFTNMIRLWFATSVFKQSVLINTTNLIKKMDNYVHTWSRYMSLL